MLQEVFSVQKATSAYLDWSEDVISFCREDHPDYIPNPGQYPLVVDPDAFVCARGALSQSFVTDVSWRSAIGQGGGEAFSLRWDGTGVVSIQPAER